MIDQAHRLRHLVRTSDMRSAVLGSAPAMVVVGGGKGGVGSSTVAIQIAMAMSRLGHRTVLVEGDLDHNARALGSVDGGTLTDVIAGRLTAQETLQPGPCGIEVLPGAWAPCDITECTATAQQRLLGELNALNAVDVLIVDLGSGRNHFVRRFWQAANLVLLVTTPDNTAVMDSYASVKVLLAGDSSVPVYSLVNMATDAATSRLVHGRLRETCRRFLGLRISIAGEVPTNSQLAHGLKEPDDAQISTMAHTTHALFDPLAQTLCDELSLVSQTSIATTFCSAA